MYNNIKRQFLNYNKSYINYIKWHNNKYINRIYLTQSYKFWNKHIIKIKIVLIMLTKKNNYMYTWNILILKIIILF
jgi:hypothetical protein